MRVAVLGSGALGSLYGAWCADGGHDVVLVARPDHADAVTSDGLTVIAPDGARRCAHVAASADIGTADDADVVLVASKAQDVEALIDAHRGTPTAVFGIQNGARQAERLVARYGPAAVGCASMVGATLEAPGVVRHTFTGATYVGPLSSSSPSAMPALRTVLGGIELVERDDIAPVLWSKAVLAVGAMGASVLLRLPYHHVFVEPGAREVFYDLVRDAADVAAARGVALVDLPGPLQAGTLMSRPRDDALDRLAQIGADLVAAGQTSVRVSMLQSLETGRRLEWQAVFGDLVEVADDHALAVPALRAVTRVARTLDDVNARGGRP